MSRRALAVAPSEGDSERGRYAVLFYADGSDPDMLGSRQGDRVFAFLDGQVLLWREMTARELATAYADPGIYACLTAHGSAQLRAPVAGADIRAGDHLIIERWEKPVLLRSSNDEAVRLAVWRALRSNSAVVAVNTPAGKAGIDAAALLSEWLNTHSPIRALASGPTTRRSKSARPRAVPSLRLIQGGAR